MIVVWTQAGREELEIIFDYIAHHSVDAAHRITDRILNAAEDLATLPLRGRTLKRTELRELVLSPLPYLLRYSVEGNHVVIANVWHGAMLDRAPQP